MDTSSKGASPRLVPRFRRQRVVDIGWMLRAAKLPGRTASVAVAIWAAATAGGLAAVTLTPTRLREVGVSRDGAYAAVERMAQAGLLKADRHRGRSVRLTLLDVKGLP